jgi:hypothetical protein
MTPDERRALDSLAPLLALDGHTTSNPFRGRRYEYDGPRDLRRDHVERTTSDLEGLQIDDGGDIDAERAFSRITAAWIAELVEAAILQSAPERALTEPTGTGMLLVHPPPAPVTRLRVSALALGPLVDAVDADARRFAFDPDQQFFRASALLATGLDGRSLHREAARQIAGDVGELIRLEAQSSHSAATQRRHEALAREFARRCRYAAAFALAAGRLTIDGRIDFSKLYRAFDAVAGLDKAPFRRGPSEHLTPELLAHMGLEFYRGLADPTYQVTFLLLTFPIKNSSGLRTNVSTEAADAGELLMLAQLRRLLEFLAALGLPNVRFVCLTDGIVYSRYLGPYDRLQAIYYRENVRHFRDALGLANRVVIVDADPLLRRIPMFERLLHHAHTILERAERQYATVQRKLLSLTRSFLFHIHTRDADPVLLAKIVNASLQGRALTDVEESAEQQRIWSKATDDARWYAAHLIVMAALGGVGRLLRGSVIRATVHPKPGQYAPAPVNARDFNDLPYHRKPLLRAGTNPLNLDTYIGANLWADRQRRYVDVYVGTNRAPFLGVQL